MFKLLNERRPGDINLKVGLGKNSGKAIFYEMDIDSVSTFNITEAENGQYHKNIVSEQGCKFCIPPPPPTFVGGKKIFFWPKCKY